MIYSIKRFTVVLNNNVLTVGPFPSVPKDQLCSMLISAIVVFGIFSVIQSFFTFLRRTLRGLSKFREVYRRNTCMPRKDGFTWLFPARDR